MKTFSSVFVLTQNPIMRAAVTPDILDILVKETLSVYENYIKGVYQQ